MVFFSFSYDYIPKFRSFHDIPSLSMVRFIYFKLFSLDFYWVILYCIFHNCLCFQTGSILLVRLFTETFIWIIIFFYFQSNCNLVFSNSISLLSSIFISDWWLEMTFLLKPWDREIVEGHLGLGLLTGLWREQRMTESVSEFTDWRGPYLSAIGFGETEKWGSCILGLEGARQVKKCGRVECLRPKLIFILPTFFFVIHQICTVVTISIYSIEINGKKSN